MTGQHQMRLPLTGRSSHHESSPTAVRVVDALRAHRFTVGAEAELQAGVVTVLASAGIPHRREAVLSRRERIDHLTLTPGDPVGIECKVAGSCADLMRQLQRYARTGKVGHLVVVTTVGGHWKLPAMIGGVPVTVVHVQTGVLG